MVSAGNVGFDCSLEDNLPSELELLLRSQRIQQGLDREAELNVCRSGSAPPTVEGSCRAIGGLLGNSSHFRDGSSNLNVNINWEFASEDDVRSHPTYSSYYYSFENLNPRLPSPLMSKEDWRVSQSFQVGGSSFVGVRDSGESLLVENGNNSSLFSIQPGACGLSVQDATDELMQLRQASRLASLEWLGRGSNKLNELSVSGMGSRTKSFADIPQDGTRQCSSLSSLCPRPQSCNATCDTIDPIIAAPHWVDISPRMVSGDGLYSRADSPGLTSVPSRCISAPLAPSFSRNMSIEAKLAGMPCSSNFPIVDGRDSGGGSTIQSGHSLSNSGIDDILAHFSDMNMSKYVEADDERLLQSYRYLARDNQMDNYRELSNLKVPPGFGSSSDLARKNEYLIGLGSPGINAGGQPDFPKHNSPSASLYSDLTASDRATVEAFNDQFQLGANILNIDLAGHHVGGRYSLDEELSSNLGSGFATGLSQLNPLNGEILERYEHELGNELSRAQYMPRSPGCVKCALSDRNNFSQMRNHFGSSPDITQLRKAYLEAIEARQKEQDSLHMGKLRAGMDRKHRGSLSFRSRAQYSGAGPVNCGLSPVGYFGHVPHNERVARISSLMRSSMGDMTNSWPSPVGANVEGRFVSSVLDEFKNNKTRSFELADILGHIVEFRCCSSDQYGSRFIQQKLETASEEEKEKIFPKILLHARSLMTDVFGNYVIQKFFEHGSESQRKELAGQLTGHVLPLSLQMYGCRVIQKALEVVDVEQQTAMVAELDGSIMKCVHDQNGNHVIQKCIECIPQDRIQFMISAFFGQVVPLSMHPYGCRVIQRVLEYCDNPNTQETVMEEIMQSVYSLAQNQYGNYVIQHVFEHGKPDERAAIIAKLSGHFVKMSQQKFASNVVEKCLTFGSSEERQYLIQEMLGSTDENEPLQAMMKDPFGNYVVQKVLEICDDRTLEFILSRIKIHLNSLKRYTYGKHIVSRVEKLITAGERRIGLSTSSLSA